MFKSLTDNCKTHHCPLASSLAVVITYSRFFLSMSTDNLCPYRWSENVSAPTGMCYHLLSPTLNLCQDSVELETLSRGTFLQKEGQREARVVNVFSTGNVSVQSSVQRKGGSAECIFRLLFLFRVTTSHSRCSSKV